MACIFPKSEGEQTGSFISLHSWWTVWMLPVSIYECMLYILGEEADYHKLSPLLDYWGHLKHFRSCYLCCYSALRWFYCFAFRLVSPHMSASRCADEAPAAQWLVLIGGPWGLQADYYGNIIALLPSPPAQLGCRIITSIVTICLAEHRMSAARMDHV